MEFKFFALSQWIEAYSTTLFKTEDMEKNIKKVKVAELKNVMANFEKLHRIGFSNLDQLKLLDNQMNTLFASLIKFQIALKRGEKQ